LANLFGAAFAGLSGFIVTWLVARALGAVDSGAFFASTSAFVLITTIAKLGTQTSLVYFPARLRTAGNVAALRRCLRAGLAPVTVASIVIAIAMWFGAGALADIAVRGGHAQYAHQLRLLAVFLPVAALSDALLAATRGWRAMRPTVMLDRLLRPGIQVALLAVLLKVDVDSPAAFILAWVVPYVPSAALAARALRRLLHTSEQQALTTSESLVTQATSQAPQTIGEATPSAPPAAAFSAAAFWRFTWPRAFASIAQLALQRVDVLLLAGIAGLRAAAIYAVAGRFVVLGQFANQGISQAVQPRLAELLAADDRKGANTLYQTATTWLVITAWPLYLMIAVFSQTYLQVFGAGFLPGTHVVVVLAAAMAIATGCGMVDMVLAMAGRTSWNLVNVSLALAVQLIVDVALIPRLGPLGAAIGLGTAILINNLLPLAQITLRLGIHPFGPALLSATALAVACFGVVPLAVARALGTGMGAAATAGVLGVSLYLLGLFRLRRILRLDALARRTPPTR
jgi:O-antigen/teichoic acid export membrane protein